MLATTPKDKKVKAVLRFEMIIAGEPTEKGTVVELSHREFLYLANHDRVLEATTENVAIVKAEIAAEKKAADATKKTRIELLKEELKRLEGEK